MCVGFLLSHLFIIGFLGVEADDQIFSIQIITAFQFLLTVICCMDCSLWLEQVAVIFTYSRLLYGL
jgi:hypothetical protein